MISNILHTFGNKILIAIISFGMLLLNAQILGSSGLATVGMIVLSITIFQLFSNLLNGSIIYFSSKLNQSTLIFVCYLWSIFCLGILWLINQLYPVFEAEYQFDIYLLALLQALISIHFFLLIGNEKIKQFNGLALIQSLSTLIALNLFYFFFELKEVRSFVNALYLAYGLTYASAIISSKSLLPRIKLSESISTFKQAIHYGIYIQLANSFQLLNYRISYYLLDAFSGRALLGLYVSGTQLSEALILPGRSIATVQYARISRKSQQSYAQTVTFFFMKLSFFITAAGVLLILLLPADFYYWLLGEDFVGVKPIIVIMSLGILMQSAEIILSHYFSGMGLQRYNTLSAAIGLSITLLAGFLLIPQYAALGGAMTSALSYGSMFLFLFILMNRQSGVKFIDFFPSKYDWIKIRRLIGMFTRGR